jgi:Xaa-Pro dipeptidase
MSALIEGRRSRLRAAMADAELDALVLGRPSDIAYATGARALWTSGSRPFSPSCVLVGDSIHLLSTWDEGVPDDIPHDHLFGLSWNPKITSDNVAAIDGLADARRIGAAGTSPGFRRLIASIAPAAELVDARRAVAAARAVKTADEIEIIERACRLARAGLDVMSGAIDVGTRPRQLLGVLAHRLGEEDDTVVPDESVAFSTADGFTTVTTDAPLERGELVALAPSVRVDGYQGTQATTVTVGDDRTDAQAGLRDRCTAALAAVVDACRPGTTGGALLDAWHGAGGGDLPVPLAHGLGLGMEPPLIGLGVGATEAITEGMVLAVQGWIHEDGVGGWFERQVVHVGADRSRVLAPGAEP